MADKIAYSALQKKIAAVPAYSVLTLDYLDTQPNYFRVQNNGNAKIYCGTAHIPNENNYDFAVPKEGLKMFAEPFDRAKLYIYNPSGTDITVSVLSFKAAFDPLTLALSDFNIDMSGVSIESASVISGFETALPSGNNNIGKVDVVTLPALPTGSNHIGEVDVGNLKDYATHLANILAAVNNVKTAVDSIEITSGGASGESNLVFHSIEGTAKSSAEDIFDMVGSVNIHKIHYIANDGESDITVSLKSANGILVSMTVKAGEVVNDIDGNFDAFMLTGNDVPYRVAVSC